MTDTVPSLPRAYDPEDALRVTVRSDGASSTLVLAGELDRATALVLRGAVDAQLSLGRVHLVVDVGGLRFIDAAGLRELLRACWRAAETRGRLVVVDYDEFFAELARACDAEDLLEPQ